MAGLIKRDEKTPSFHVRPQLGLWHCFGCGEGGDVISFVEKINHLSFAEAVEYLAGRVGVQLRYEDSSGDVRRGVEPGTRQRLLEANRVAEEWFRSQLSPANPAAASVWATRPPAGTTWPGTCAQRASQRQSS